MSEPAPIIVRGTSRQCLSCTVNLRMPWRKKYVCPYCLIKRPKRFADTDDVWTLILVAETGPGEPKKRISVDIAANRLSPGTLAHLQRRGLLGGLPAEPKK